ncbi:hypothetical protein BJF90_43675 [Pseudonocardia sp. CNS-004]|nr:hypothetical protein BJF90_43675 [Pseudonocardia sp. CNS-004]
MRRAAARPAAGSLLVVLLTDDDEGGRAGGHLVGAGDEVHPLRDRLRRLGPRVADAELPSHRRDDLAQLRHRADQHGGGHVAPPAPSATTSCATAEPSEPPSTPIGPSRKPNRSRSSAYAGANSSAACVLTGPYRFCTASS